MAKFPVFLDTCTLVRRLPVRLAAAAGRGGYLLASLLSRLDLYPGHTVAAPRDQARSYSAPAMSIEDLLGRLASAGVPKFAAEAPRYLWPADPVAT